MNEVKTPKKNWFYYYTIVLLILIILNTFIMPLIQQHSVKEVDYGTFISMTEKKEIGKVEIESNQIVFTNKDESQIYKTGLMDDPNRTERLYESGAEFSSEIIEQMSPLVSFLLTWILPLVIFFALGQYMSKKLMKRLDQHQMNALQKKWKNISAKDLWMLRASLCTSTSISL